MAAMEQPQDDKQGARSGSEEPGSERTSLRSSTSTIDIYIKLAQYPILADRLRDHMRQELFRRGIISPEKFEEEVRELRKKINELKKK